MEEERIEKTNISQNTILWLYICFNDKEARCEAEFVLKRQRKTMKNVWTVKYLSVYICIC